MAHLNLLVNGTCVGPVSLVSLGDGLFRFNETFFWGFFAEDEDELASLPNPGYVILTKQSADGELEFIRVQRRGNFKMHSVVLASTDIDNPALAALLREVGREGGSWERQMGGLLTVGLPPESPMDFPKLLGRALGGA